MRVCRFQRENQIEFGYYLDENKLVPLSEVASLRTTDGNPLSSLLEILPGGNLHDQFTRLQETLTSSQLEDLAIPAASVKLLTPIAIPGKLLLLAGNYADHIREGGGEPEDRSRTFPYVFMKPLTTLTHPGDPIRIPAISPNQIDWELELAIIIGKTCFGVSPEKALDVVAGYTVVNDISDRGFRPNPSRQSRPRDPFFDWLHGKWHDTFCPMGPCVLPATECSDPQSLKLTLKVNDRVEQDGNTAEMIFPVREIISFISSFVTLHPGDVICTGTPAGVGKAKGRFLKPGDTVSAEIEGVGCLRNPVE
ncbi:MAG TPA: fumarylacetoacetate hydrolase family protein [Planctomicrobium sp.]|nr:fumarylacetoacetate hydrolase family protein [Planctomicrobium sp.]